VIVVLQATDVDGAKALGWRVPSPPPVGQVAGSPYAGGGQGAGPVGHAARRIDWLAGIECLTVEFEGDRRHTRFEDARARITRLAVQARALADAVPADFPGHPDAQEAAALARMLATTAPGPAAQEPAPAADRAAMARAYLEALREAADAVYYCRKVQHPAGSCWFSVAGPEADVCGRVLALTHRLCSTGAERQRDDHTGAPT
jgi:hypothetical protein